jgi:hypothetical protein
MSASCWCANGGKESVEAGVDVADLGRSQTSAREGVPKLTGVKIGSGASEIISKDI